MPHSTLQAQLDLQVSAGACSVRQACKSCRCALLHTSQRLNKALAPAILLLPRPAPVHVCMRSTSISPLAAAEHLRRPSCCRRYITGPGLVPRELGTLTGLESLLVGYDRKSAPPGEAEEENAHRLRAAVEQLTGLTSL